MTGVIPPFVDVPSATPATFALRLRHTAAVTRVIVDGHTLPGLDGLRRVHGRWKIAAVMNRPPRLAR